VPRGPALLAALGILLAVTACSGDDDDGGDPSESTEEPSPEPTAAAGPVTIQVEAGAAEEPVFVRAFLPEDVTIRAGDSISWTAPAGEHTVTFLGEAEPFPLIVPEPASPADAVLNPRVVDPEPNPRADSFDGSFLYNSGTFGGDEGESPTLTFPAPGTFEYQCLIHPQMSGTVSVLDEPEGDAPQQAEVTSEADEQRAEYLAEGRDALTELQDSEPESAPGPNETTVWQVVAGFSTDHTDVRAFVPDSIEIEPGDTVVWVNQATEPHTVTFGEPLPFETVETLANGQVRRVLNPDILNVALGGFEFIEGEYYHSGLLLEDGPLGTRFQLLFPDAGRFEYIDSLYFDVMRGVVVVND
jgi:plastocyanin